MEAGTLCKAVHTYFNNCPMVYLFILPCCEVTEAQIYTETIRSLVQSLVGLLIPLLFHICYNQVHQQYTLRRQKSVNL